MKQILICDDDNAFRSRLAQAFKRRGFSVHDVSSIDEARNILTYKHFDGVIVDLRLPGESGLSLLEMEQEKLRDIPTVVLTGYGSIGTTVQALKLGAVNYLTKPAGLDDILNALGFLEGQAHLPDSTSAPNLAENEWHHIQRVLTECNGNISEASRILGIHRRSLQRKLAKAPQSLK